MVSSCITLTLEGRFAQEPGKERSQQGRRSAGRQTENYGLDFEKKKSTLMNGGVFKKKKSFILQLEKKQQEREIKGKADEANPKRLQEAALALHVGEEGWGQFERQLFI